MVTLSRKRRWTRVLTRRAGTRWRVAETASPTAATIDQACVAVEHAVAEQREPQRESASGSAASRARHERDDEQPGSCR